MAGEDTSKIIDAEFLQAFHKGKEHFDNNRLEEAKVFLEKARTLKPNDEKVLNLLGMIYFKLNYLTEAEEIYLRLVSTNEGVYVLHSNLGLIQLKLGKFKEAEKSLLRALELQPNNPKAQVYVGLLYEKLGNYQRALEYFSKGGAHKLVEQMKEKIAASKMKEEIIEEAEIIEVIEKRAEEKKAALEAKEGKIEFEEKIKEEKVPEGLLRIPEKEEKEEALMEEGESEKKEVEVEFEETEKETSADMVPPEETYKPPEDLKAIREMATALGVEIKKSPLVEQEVQEEIIIEEKEHIKESEKEEILAQPQIIEEPAKFEEEKEKSKEEQEIPQTYAEAVVSEEKVQEEETPTIVEEKKEAAIFPEKEEQVVSIIEPIYKPLSLDYFSRDKFYIQPLTGADRFLLIDPHLLEIVLSEEVIIRKGSISSYSGKINFELLKFDNVEIPLVKCQGAGVLFLTHERREIFLFSLNNEEVNIEESHFLLAQSSLHIEAKLIESKTGLLNYLNIKGTGTIGITIKSAPLTLNILASMPVNIYSDALIAWSGKVDIKLIEEEQIKGIMARFSENAFPIKFEGIGDVVVEQGILWGDRRAK